MSGAIQQAIRGEVVSVEFRLSDAAGRELRLAAVIFPAGEGAGAIILDVTRERELAERMVRLQHLEAVGALAAGAAHDFNNLLTAILGNLFLLESCVEADDEAREYIDGIRRSTERGAELVQRLLEYSRPAGDGTERVELAQLLRETVELAGLSVGTAIALDLDAAGLADAEIIGNRIALQMVIVNLLLHVQGSMQAGGTISITSEVVILAPDDAREHDDLAPGPYAVFAIGSPVGAPSTATTAADADDGADANSPGQGSGLGSRWPSARSGRTAARSMSNHTNVRAITSASGCPSLPVKRLTGPLSRARACTRRSCLCPSRCT